jgi:putative transposase
LLGLSRAVLYYKPAAISNEELDLMRFLDEEYTAHPFYGVRRMCVAAQAAGWSVGVKRIRRLLRLMGLYAIGPKPNTSAPAPGHRIFPYLLRALPSQAQTTTSPTLR